MIALTHLSFHYPQHRQYVFEDFSLELQPGKIYGLLGKNGSGKSTLLQLICGLLTPQKGEATVDGKKVRQRRPETMQQLFLVPEEFTLPPVRLQTFVHNLACFYPNFSREDLCRYLEAFELEEDLRLHQLSMGQKKKVFISFALATNTPYLIMDEPTNGLDIIGKSQFRKIVASCMTDDKTMLISTHQVRDIDQLLDHLVIIHENKVVLHHDLADLCRQLQCVQSHDPQLLARAIYAQPSLQGNQLLLPNPEGKDSVLQLELLFSAVLSQPEKVAACLKDDAVGMK